MFDDSATHEATVRLLAAVTIGCLIGIDRNLSGKPTGIKTMGLVSLGAALVTMASMGFSVGPGADSAAASRAIQGIVTGVGFLGAGVILQTPSDGRVRGLTTAASIWVTAALGIVCGIGAWRIAAIATIMVLVLLIFGRAAERALHRQWLNKPEDKRKEIVAHDE